jgi:hypothetical protein
MVQIRPEILPHRRAMTGRKPGRQNEIDHQDHATNRRRPHQQAKNQAHRNPQLAPRHQPRAKHRMPQRDIHEHGFVESHHQPLVDPPANPTLKTKRSKFAPHNFIFRKQEKDNPRSNPRARNRFLANATLIPACCRLHHCPAHFGGSTANTRQGPPEPPSSLIGAAIMYAPDSGRYSACARFSRLYKPAGRSTRCTS